MSEKTKRSVIRRTLFVFFGSLMLLLLTPLERDTSFCLRHRSYSRLLDLNNRLLKTIYGGEWREAQ